MASRRYRKIYARLWTNADFQRLTDGEKVLTLYLLSGPQTNRVGLYRISIGSACEDLRIRAKDFNYRLERVCQAFGWVFDELARVLWIPSWWSFNPPGEKANNFKGALTDLGEVPDSPLLARFCGNRADIPDALRSLLDPWLSVPTEFEQCSNTVETELEPQEKKKKKEIQQEKQTQQEKERERDEHAPAARPPTLTPEQVVDAWNQHVTPPIPKVEILSDDRRKSIAARIRTFPHLGDWIRAIQWINAQEWCRAPGRGEHPNWTATLDWLTKKDSTLARYVELSNTRAETPPGVSAKTQRNLAQAALVVRAAEEAQR